MTYKSGYVIVSTANGLHLVVDRFADFENAKAACLKRAKEQFEGCYIAKVVAFSEHNTDLVFVK